MAEDWGFPHCRGDYAGYLSEGIPEIGDAEGSTAFFKLAYVIATNHCKAWLRKERLRIESLENTESVALEKATYSGYVISENEQTTIEAQREVVKELLAKLQESERTIVTLRYFGEMSSAEIGEFLGVSANTVRSRLRHALEHLKKEEPMIREALENFQITPNLTENIMQEIARLKPITPFGSKPLVPWAIGVSALAVVLSMLGIANHQSLSRFQKPYSFDAASEMKVELIETPVVLNLKAKPGTRTQLGNLKAPNQNNGAGNQVDDAASLDLETIITKMKHYDNAVTSVTSVTGDFVMERHRDLRISIQAGYSETIRQFRYVE